MHEFAYDDVTIDWNEWDSSPLWNNTIKPYLKQFKEEYMRKMLEPRYSIPNERRYEIIMRYQEAANLLDEIINLPGEMVRLKQQEYQRETNEVGNKMRNVIRKVKQMF